MVQAWYMDNNPNVDQRQPHHLDPPRYVDVKDLEKIGVLHYGLDPHNYEADLEKIRKERNYNFADHLTCSHDKLPNYDEKIKMFFNEHLHTDEEIRFIEDGSGYFDVRDLDDRWIRILVQPGDLLILPAGIYHRFTLDTNDYIKVTRLFCGVPVWTPLNRPADNEPTRQAYLDTVKAA